MRRSISLAATLRPVCVALLLALAACSPKTYALRNVADALSSESKGGAFARDDDPELVGDAVPFALKTMEQLADSLPDHAGVRLGMARGFTQYAYGWVQLPADELAEKDLARAKEEQDRAARLYLRARGYGLDGLRITRGIKIEELRGTEQARSAALARLNKDDVPMLYWTFAAWGAAISLRKQDMDLVGDVPAVAAMLDRALSLDETYGEGALQEFALQIDPARPEGTTPEKQRAHFDRARALQKGKKISALVTFAEAVAGPGQDRKLFESLLKEAVDFDVEKPEARDDRLANVLARRRAKFLLAHESDILSD
ncbi:MAG TPA: TRAP transporter TatT component family protein [Myxococcales bacterium]|nr:TRAP transporter TatT component family protein [Myxococcales bacterium]